VIELQQPAASPSPPEASAQPPAVSGGPTHPSRATAKRPKIPGIVQHADGQERARITVYISVLAAVKLRRHCFENGLEISEVAGRELEEMVERLG
jgi:hypothetical protein